MKYIISVCYGVGDIDWWCWKYDFDKRINLSARTIYKDDDSIIPTYGFICLSDGNIIDVVELIKSYKSYKRNITIEEILGIMRGHF
jgi:hypothetical protein